MRSVKKTCAAASPTDAKAAPAKYLAPPIDFLTLEEPREGASQGPARRVDPLTAPLCLYPSLLSAPSAATTPSTALAGHSEYRWSEGMGVMLLSRLLNR